MDARELRIGNLLNLNGEIVEVLTISKTSIRVKINNELEDILCNINELKPIPVTEEWLVKLGFHESSFSKLQLSVLEYGWIGYRHGKLYLCYCDGGDAQGQDLDHIEQIHQLQNLYVGLTNWELEIK